MMRWTDVHDTEEWRILTRYFGTWGFWKESGQPEEAMRVWREYCQEAWEEYWPGV